MICVETPLSTIDQEIALLERVASDNLSHAYTLGAIDALKWMKTREQPPSEWIERRNLMLVPPGGNG